jgi:hypothetical protein
MACREEGSTSSPLGKCVNLRSLFALGFKEIPRALPNVEGHDEAGRASLDAWGGSPMAFLILLGGLSNPPWRVVELGGCGNS